MRRIVTPILILFFWGQCWSISNAQQAQPKTIGVSEKAQRFHEALKERPNSETLFARFVDTWLETDSLENLGRYLNNDSNSPQDWFILARFYLHQNFDDDAMEVFQKIVQSKQTATQSMVAQAKLNLSQIASRNQQFEQSLTLLKEAKTSPEANPSNKNLLNDIAKQEGQLLIRMDRHSEGLESWKSLLKQYPEDRYLNEDVVELLLNEGLYDQAIEQQQLLIKQIETSYDHSQDPSRPNL